MKKYLVLIVFCFSICSFAQIVTIPDANFKAALISNGVDANTDGEIQESEALAVTLLNVSQSNISDLTGIQSFTNVQMLYCVDNLLTSINVTGLSNLTKFVFTGNSDLISLDVSNCTSLTELFFVGNNLSFIDVSGCISLTQINLESNNLSSIDASGLVSLVNLICFDNQLTNINVDGCVSLYFLECFGNQLTTLNLNNLPNLGGVRVNANSLTSINMSNLPMLSALECANNPLVSLDISNLPMLSNLYFGMNGFPHQYLNLKNGILNTLSFVSPIASVQYVCADDFEVISYSSFPQIQTVSSYCSFTPGGNYNTITGMVTYDLNSDGCDVNDQPKQNIRMNINDSTSQNQGATFTSSEGIYNFYTNTGSFTLTPNIENPTWFTFLPDSATISFDDNNNNIANQNFCLSANGIHTDAEIVIAPIVPARPGFTAIYQVLIKNKGNFMLSGQFMLSYNDGLLDFLDSGIFPNAQIEDSLIWNFADLQPFGTIQTNVSFMVNAPTDVPPVNIGDELNFQALVTTTESDENPQDNVFDFNQIVVGSFDPNDITCLEGDVVSTSEIGEYLHYVINFENTGNSEAENIVVRTEINPVEFDVNSLQMLNTSHNAYIRQNGNVVEFIFQNIALESGGHGNVLLKIKTKDNLQNGATVGKQANIYFDYNAPIETNLANTTFETLSNGDFEVDHSISVHPNPTTSVININCDNTIKSIQLYDFQGRLLQTQIVNNTISTIDISNQSNGVYFAKITSEVGVKVEKIIKE